MFALASWKTRPKFDVSLGLLYLLTLQMLFCFVVCAREWRPRVLRTQVCFCRMSARCGSRVPGEMLLGGGL